MARARLYSLNTDAVKNATGKTKEYLKNLRGQAKVVFDELARDTTPRLAVDINEKIHDKYFPVPRQEPFRITLYYIVVFRGKGIVKAKEVEEVEPENAFAGILDENGNILETENEN